MAWKVPNTTHRYLIECISGSLHPKVMLASRYNTFVNSLMKSPKYSVRVLANLCATDHRTVMGQSLAQISRECGLSRDDKLSSNTIKDKMKYFSAPQDQEWRIGILCELLDNKMEIKGFNDAEIKLMVSHLCTTKLSWVVGTVHQLSEIPVYVRKQLPNPNKHSAHPSVTARVWAEEQC